MPEEINRIVTDSITNYFFTTTELAGNMLKKTGVEEDRIYFVGNTMIDTLLRQMPHFRKPPFWDEYQLAPQQYLVLTLHRPSNVDDETQLRSLFEVIERASKSMPVIFPAHPRTTKNMERFGIQLNNVKLVEPMGYLEFNYLVQHAKAVITDSGGVTEETTVMNVPCMTIRENTERPETCTMGTNELLGTKPEALEAAMNRVMEGNWKKGSVPPLWDGHTAERIVSAILSLNLGDRGE
jgi:UDP-N-acetylglucosamine 2-epimerase (non-hydrolysing)